MDLIFDCLDQNSDDIYQYIYVGLLLKLTEISSDCKYLILTIMRDNKIGITSYLYYFEIFWALLNDNSSSACIYYTKSTVSQCYAAPNNINFDSIVNKIQCRGLNILDKNQVRRHFYPELEFLKINMIPKLETQA